ncbi:dual specificity protein phosphatase family protein [Flavobacterium sp. DGU11]|uniref:Dual specificity protein phosphatase family protein n=1 Tax=Flavobacterium arundinis TaxID=3139143 RepID=A0ABU9HVN6_9FLAO
MRQIKDLRLFIGTKEQYQIAYNRGMKIVCALNRANGYVSHQSVVGWRGKGCNPDSLYYLYKREPDAIYLNMIDGDDPKYVNDAMINPALDFIHQHLNDGNEVFIYCSLGESRSPSIALMYLLEKNLIEKNSETLTFFQKEYYPSFNPKKGNLFYIKNRWNI